MDLAVEDYKMILAGIDGLVVVNEKGIILHFDQKTALGMGKQVEDFVGRYVREVLPLTKIHTVLETKQHDIGDVYYIEDPNHRQHPIVISTRHPIYRGDQFAGVIEYDLFESYQVLKQFLKTTESLTNDMNYVKRKNQHQGYKYTLDNLVGSSNKMKILRQEIIKASNSHSTVVITGETGSGKELVAHSIHHLSKRKQQELVRINCSAIPSELFESELFGYEEGSFTSAKKGGKLGKFELANKGTLFFDEINTLPPAMQPKLLRALQEKEIDKVGGKYSVPIDVRVICATNQRLEDLVAINAFREDLYFRLNVIPITIPPLRDRLEDIPDLVYSIVEQLNILLGRRINDVSSDILQMLQNYDWPGNIRELQNILERAMNNVDAKTEILTIREFPSILKSNLSRKPAYLQPHQSIQEALALAEREIIAQAMDACHGNKSEAAKMLGIARPVLYKKMARLNLK